VLVVGLVLWLLERWVTLLAVDGTTTNLRPRNSRGSLKSFSYPRGVERVQWQTPHVDEHLTLPSKARSDKAADRKLGLYAL